MTWMNMRSLALLAAIAMWVVGCETNERARDVPDDPAAAAALPPRERAPALGMMGVASDVPSVVYVIDASGSLIDTLPFVIHELRMAIHELRADQRFTALFYNDEQIIEMPPAGLALADDAGKAAALRWLDSSYSVVVPMGGAHPEAVFARARSLEPHTVMMLSDQIEGVGHRRLDADAMQEQVRKFADAGIVVHTLQWLYPDPVQGFGGTPALKLIAEGTGGTYRFISARDLGIE